MGHGYQGKITYIASPPRVCLILVSETRKMYNVHEKKLDVLLLEGTRLVDMLSHSSRVSSSDVRQFGNALLEVQTEVRRQLSPETIEHLFANKGVMR